MKYRDLLKPDYIFHSGSVYTADAQDTVYEAVAVTGNLIAALGSTEEILALAADTTQVVDLHGRAVIPGINDAHNHPWEAGLMLDGLVLFGLDSIAALQKAVRERVFRMEPGQWLQGGSYIESQFAENRPPDRRDLDAAAPDNPVVLERIFGACVANSAALRAAGITRDTPDPEKGRIHRDADGEPTGVLDGTAVLLVRAAMPGPFGSDEFGAGTGEPSVELTQRSILRAMEEYRKYGITSVTEPGCSATVCKAYHQLLSTGRMGYRVSLMPNWHGFTLKQDETQLDRLLETYPFASGFGNAWIRYGGLKMAIDGGLTSGTALKSWPYKGENAPRQVQLRLDLDKLDGYVKNAHDHGWDVGIHVMGDIAVERAVDAIYKAVQANPRPHRHHIIHAYYPTEEALEKMARAGILAACQASFIYGECDGYPHLLPLDKQESFTPLRSYVDHGITVALSTDMPCAHINPFWNLYSAVTRKGMRGHCLGTKECISVLEGIKMLTYNGACIDSGENEKGSLEPGKLADLVVLDRDIGRIKPEELRHTLVDLTMLDGKVIYTR